MTVRPEVADRLREHCEKLCVALAVTPGETWPVLYGMNTDKARHPTPLPTAHFLVRNRAKEVCQHWAAAAATPDQLFARTMWALGWDELSIPHVKALAYVIARKTLYKQEEHRYGHRTLPGRTVMR